MKLDERLQRVPAWAWALLFACVICLPRLGAFGFWDPWELKVADQARAMALSLVGDRLPAAQAAEWGLIWRCVDDAELMNEAQALVARVARAPAHAALELRRAFRLAGEQDLAAQLDYEADRQAERVQTSRHVRNARHAAGTLRDEERGEAGLATIEEVREHVHVAPTFDGGDLDPGDETYAPPGRFRSRFIVTIRRVVVGHRENVNAGHRCPSDQIGRRQASVRCRCVEVEVDHSRCGPAVIV